MPKNTGNPRNIEGIAILYPIGYNTDMKNDINSSMQSAISAIVQRAEMILAMSDASRQDKAQCRMDLLMPKVHDRLIASGWKPEYVSGGSSFYYSKGDRRLRVSDHDVPLTAEREYNASNGGFSWASKGEKITLEPCIGEAGVWAEIDCLDEDE